MWNISWARCLNFLLNGETSVPKIFNSECPMTSLNWFVSISCTTKGFFSYIKSDISNLLQMSRLVRWNKYNIFFPSTDVSWLKFLNIPVHREQNPHWVAECAHNVWNLPPPPTNTLTSHCCKQTTFIDLSLPCCCSQTFLLVKNIFSQVKGLSDGSSVSGGAQSSVKPVTVTASLG